MIRGAQSPWVPSQVSISTPIDRVEPGSIWFEGTGPVNVAKAATDLAQPGWSVNVVLARLGGSWHIVEVGNVYV